MNHESRIARLESQLARQRRLALFLLIALTALLGYGAAEPADPAGPLRTERIVVVNGKGVVVAEIGSDINGGWLRLNDNEGDERVWLGASGPGAKLDLKSIAGEILITAQAGFAAGMMRVDAGLLKVGSKKYGATVIMANRVRSDE